MRTILLAAAILAGAVALALVLPRDPREPPAPVETVGERATRLCTQEVGPDRARIENCVTTLVLQRMHDTERARTERLRDGMR